ncbi:uncharacterized protein LOC124168674 [Ischnura elegans]|uniref:uncharacterized protein LOC124168674 n=1 Tax=Ischnura elegans TaxID=197161 RepID=UPI001ED895F6|nr:uncharacterized protein LOC124168674 [Ischnura elegans]XP_046402902.1 uncharacterized protein LOC124168674 [Ischnura elegans]
MSMMDNQLLIDLGTSPRTIDMDSDNALIGFTDIITNSTSSINLPGNAVPSNCLATDIVKEVSATCIDSKNERPSVMKVKSHSVDSLSDLNSLGILPLPGSPAVARKQQGVNLDQHYSSRLLFPFSTPKLKSTASLATASLLDDEPANLLSPFGWTPKRNNLTTMGEVIHVENVPVGDLVEVQVTESVLPDDMFDIDTLGKKQLELSKTPHSVQPTPTVQVLLPSLSSIGSEDMNSNDALNQGFMGSVSEESVSLPTPNDSVFEEAQELAKIFKKMGVAASSTTMDSIEDEDGSIVDDCPDLKDDADCLDIADDVLGSESSRSSCLEPKGSTWHRFSYESIIDNMEEEARNEKFRKGSVAFSDIASQGSVCDSFDCSSNISAFTPSPLSIGSVENLKLKAHSLIGNQLSNFPLKLRASSCSSVQSAKPGPMKALMPLNHLIMNEVATPSTARDRGKSHDVGTPHMLAVNSPLEGVNLMRRMSSTPKPCIPDNSSSVNKNNINNSSSQKKPNGRKMNKREGMFSSATKKPGETLSVPARQSSSAKSLGSQNGIVKGELSARRSPANSNHSTKSSAVSQGNGNSVPITKGSKHYPSPLLRRKVSSSPSVMKTPSRSISTGSLCSTSSTKKANNSPQMPSLLSKGRSNSSSKLPLSSSVRPLSEACLNSPARHSSPLQKLVSKFRRNFTPKEMKENVLPK